MAWNTANPDHAIDRASVSFHYSSLPEKALHKLSNLVKSEAAKLRLDDVLSFQPQPPFQLFGAVGASVMSTFPVPLPSQSFRRMAGDRVAEEIICGPDFLIYNAYDYDGWASIFPRIVESVSSGIDYLNDNIEGVQTVKFEYWDRFTRDEVDGQSLLNANSRLVGPGMKDSGGSWHSHVGFFKTIDDLKMLLNANVDVISARDTFAPENPVAVMPAGVGSLCRVYLLSQVTFEKARLYPDLKTCLKAVDRSHDELKSVLGDIVNEELAAKINLGAREFKL